MIDHLGPKIWDRVGPGIGGAFWDDPSKKDDGMLCYSAIDRAAGMAAWTGLAQFLFSLPVGLAAFYALLADPKIWAGGGYAVMAFLFVAFSALSAFKFIQDIRWTQLSPTMAADGVCDDLFVTDEDEEYLDEPEEADEIEEEEPQADENKIVLFREDDDWESAS